MLTTKDRIIGGIMGVVVGDALGLPVQFMSREAVQLFPVKDMIGYGTFNLPPGSWSDDSSLTLCLAESLTEKGFDLLDIKQRFITWLKDGYMTPYGYSYDVGGTTMRAIRGMEKDPVMYTPDIKGIRRGPAGESDNGNGSLMRILPAALFFAKDPGMVQKVGKMSAMTHGHIRSQIACGFYSVMACLLLEGVEAPLAYQAAIGAFRDYVISRPTEREPFKRILLGDIRSLPENEIQSGGYVIHSLEAAIWCLLRHDNYRDTVLAAVNLGEDTDTTAAIAGGLAGIMYGIQGIPEEWIKALVRCKDVLQIAENFALACK